MGDFDNERMFPIALFLHPFCTFFALFCPLTAHYFGAESNTDSFEFGTRFGLHVLRDVCINL